MWIAVALGALAAQPKDRAGDVLPPGVVARYGTQRLCYDRFIDVNTTARLTVAGSTVWGHSHPTNQYSKGVGPLIAWDAGTGRELFRAAPGKDVLRTDFDPAGRYRMEAIPNRSVRVVAAAGKTLGVYRLGGEASSQPLGLVGDRLAVTDRVGGDGVIRLQPADATALAPPSVTFGMAGTVALSPDGRELVAVSVLRRELRKFDTSTGQLLAWVNLPGDIESSSRIAFSSTGRSIALTRFRKGERGRSEGVADVFDDHRFRQEARLVIPTDDFAPSARRMEVSDDARFAAWPGPDGRLFVHNADAGRTVAIPLRAAPEDFRFTTNGKLAVVLTQGVAVVFDPATGRDAHAPLAPAAAIHSACVSPDGKLVAGAGDDGSVWVWDAVTAAPLWHAPSGELGYCGVRFDASGKFVISSKWTPTAVVFDARTGARIGDNLPSANWTGTAVLDGGKRFLDVVADEPQFGAAFVRVRELATGKEVRKVELQESGGWQSSMQAAVSADGKVIVLRRPSFGDLGVYDAATGKLQRTLHLETGPYLCHELDLSPDGRTLAARMTPSSMYDVPMHLIAFDISADRVLGKHSCGDKDKMFHTAAVSPDGRYAAGCVGKNGTTVVLDLRNGAEVRELTGEAVAFFPDCRSLLTVPHIRGVERVSLEPAAWRSRPPLKPTDSRLSQLWKALAEPGEAGFDAVLELGRFPEMAKPFLAAKLAEGVPDAKKVAEWIGQLSSKVFADREAASKALREAGPGVLPAVRAALKTATNAEARMRLEKAIHALTDTSHPDYLRRLRAEEVLERGGR